MTDRSTALLDAARSMLPDLTAREPAPSLDRRVSDETIAAFHRCGILRVMYGRHNAYKIHTTQSSRP